MSVAPEQDAPRTPAAPEPGFRDAVTFAFKQVIAADEPLLTGTYGKTLTFTLSTATP